jgi:serine/threonine protein kinase
MLPWADQRALTEAQISRVVMQLLQGIKYLHDNGIEA